MMKLLCALVWQAGASTEPRRRYGLFQGLRKRNKSESEASRQTSVKFRLWGAKAPSPQPEPFAESEHENSGDEVFQSPRCALRLCCHATTTRHREDSIHTSVHASVNWLWLTLGRQAHPCLFSSARLLPLKRVFAYGSLVPELAQADDAMSAAACIQQLFPRITSGQKPYQ